MAAESARLLLVNSSPGLSIRMGDAQLVIELTRSQRVRARYWLKIIFVLTLNYLEVLRSILISFSIRVLSCIYNYFNLQKLNSFLLINKLLYKVKN